MKRPWLLTTIVITATLSLNKHHVTVRNFQQPVASMMLIINLHLHQKAGIMRPLKIITLKLLDSLDVHFIHLYSTAFFLTSRSFCSDSDDICSSTHRYMRLEVPLHIVPKDHISRPCLDSLVDLPRIISEEEEEAYTKTTQIPNMDLVAKIQNGSGSWSGSCHESWYSAQFECCVGMMCIT